MLFFSLKERGAYTFKPSFSGDLILSWSITQSATSTNLCDMKYRPQQVKSG
jgi:hypothetical protein